MDDVTAACRIFMDAFWESSRREPSITSGYIIAGVDIAGPVKAVIDATRKECADQALQINDEISKGVER